jgi:hypothetical protein
MHCIIVNGANLKADAFCACCRSKIGDSYIREIGGRRIYCGRACYHGEAEVPIVALGYRRRQLSMRMFGS